MLFGKVAGPKSATLPKNKLYYKYFSKEKSKTSKERVRILKSNVYYVTYFQLLRLVRLTDLWSTFYKTRMNRLNGQYRLWTVRLIKKKGKHGKYSVEVHNGKYSTWKVWCMKRIWKLHDDARINCFKWYYSTHRDIYVFALLRLDIVKNSICIVSFLLVL